MAQAPRTAANRLAQEVVRGTPRAVARAISLVEDNESHARELLVQLFPKQGEALILGVTGAPGSGKSTLVDQMIDHFRAERSKVGVIAVDPSSPFTGGAVLGDRIRMMRHSLDPEVFIRSMATRGHLGGLSKATAEALVVLAAAGKDILLVETVGVGQDEVEVVKLADVVCVVLTPGAGDDIQTFKAGILEIGDIFVLNKADAPGAETIERQLRAMLESGVKDRPAPAIVRTVATTGQGVKELRAEIRRFHSRADKAFREARRKRFLSWMLKDVLADRVYEGIARRVPDREFERLVDLIYQKKIDPYTAAERILARSALGSRAGLRGGH